MYIDIHTHIHKETNSTHLRIYNIELQNITASENNTISSIGIHPWHIPQNPEKAIAQIKAIAQKENILAIGECGIDKLCETPIELQIKLFKAQIEISEGEKKPLIIHCVKSYNEIVELKNKIRPTQTWIIHGFRGKPQTATMLTGAGIILSIGEKYNPETIKNIPIKKILIESDESTLSIEEIYQNIAQTRGIEVAELENEVEKTYKSIFKQNITTII